MQDGNAISKMQKNKTWSILVKSKRCMRNVDTPVHGLWGIGI